MSVKKENRTLYYIQVDWRVKDYNNAQPPALWKCRIRPEDNLVEYGPAKSHRFLYFTSASIWYLEIDAAIRNGKRTMYGLTPKEAWEIAFVNASEKHLRLKEEATKVESDLWHIHYMLNELGDDNNG